MENHLQDLARKTTGTNPGSHPEYKTDLKAHNRSEKLKGSQ